MTTVSVLIPCLQEIGFIRPCLDSVLQFEVPENASLTEIMVIDGGSTDGTREVVTEYAARDPRVKLIDNPGRIQSTGLNIALRTATGDYIVRLDAHSSYPQNYLTLLLETSLR